MGLPRQRVPFLKLPLIALAKPLLWALLWSIWTCAGNGATTCPDAQAAAKLLQRMKATRPRLRLLTLAVEELDEDEKSRAQEAPLPVASVFELDTACRAANITLEQAEQREKALGEAGRCDGLLSGGSSFLKGFSKGVVPWSPRPEKFLLTSCQKGQVSNRIRCYRKSILLAGFSNRTLVLLHRRSEIRLHYNPRLLVPLDTLRTCYGRDAIITTAEYRKAHGGSPLVVNKILCWEEVGKRCFNPLDDGTPVRHPHSVDIRYPPAVNMTFLGLPGNKPVDVTEVVKRMEAAAEGASVVLLDELQARIMEVPSIPGLWGDLPFLRMAGCPNTLSVQPHPAVFLAARRFVMAKGFRDGYVGVHWRRSDLMNMCDNKLCRLSPSEAASCIVSVLKEMGLKNLFLASDGSKSEVSALVEAVKQEVPGLKSVSLGQFWDDDTMGKKFFAQRGIVEEDRSMIQLMMDKVVCALSTVFLGTMASSYSTDIERLREGLRQSTCRDSHLCYTTNKT